MGGRIRLRLELKTQEGPTKESECVTLRMGRSAPARPWPTGLFARTSALVCTRIATSSSSSALLPFHDPRLARHRCSTPNVVPKSAMKMPHEVVVILRR